MGRRRKYNECDFDSKQNHLKSPLYPDIKTASENVVSRLCEVVAPTVYDDDSGMIAITIPGQITPITFDLGTRYLTCTENSKYLNKKFTSGSLIDLKRFEEFEKMCKIGLIAHVKKLLRQCLIPVKSFKEGYHGIFIDDPDDDRQLIVLSITYDYSFITWTQKKGKLEKPCQYQEVPDITEFLDNLIIRYVDTLMESVPSEAYEWLEQRGFEKKSNISRMQMLIGAFAAYTDNQ